MTRDSRPEKHRNSSETDDFGARVGAIGSLGLEGINQLWVAGYKSVLDEQRIEIRPLTILAGANSSGKSSLVQPLLLLKQTLEVGYDAGALYLNGPHVKFTAASQIFSRLGKSRISTAFRVGLRIGANVTVELLFRRSSKAKGFEIEKMKFSDSEGIDRELFPEMNNEQILRTLPDSSRHLYEIFNKSPLPRAEEALKLMIDPSIPLKLEWRIFREKCFLEPQLVFVHPEMSSSVPLSLPLISTVAAPFDAMIRSVIHVPGIRGNPERTYPVTAVGDKFPGLFHHYAASVIAQWQTAEKRPELRAVAQDLELLGLTWRVSARPVQDTQVEIRVGRLGHRGDEGSDMVNIADVGLAMSQVLPVIVALHVARPGQLVFIEQPEMHLHPKAQIALAQVVANAAQRGVKVLVETHSSLFLLGLQTLIAEEKLDPRYVKLHWVNRDSKGFTKLSSADVDEAGAFGDWPEDFGDVTLEAENKYLTASERKFVNPQSE
jgi:hypothetical protein